MSREAHAHAASTEDGPAEIASAFESREFSSEELAAIKKTRRRSPRLGEAKAEVQTFRAPPSLVDRIRERATSDGTTESQVIRHALEAYLSQD